MAPTQFDGLYAIRVVYFFLETVGNPIENRNRCDTLRHFGEELHMNTIQSTLFTDPQAETRVIFCPVCGGHRYPPTYTCIRCEADEP